MKWTEATIREDVSRYLTGRISGNELIRRNDEAVEWLKRNDLEPPKPLAQAWAVAAEVERLLVERGFGYISESRLHELLQDFSARPLLMQHPKSAVAIREDWQMYQRRQPKSRRRNSAGGGLLSIFSMHPFAPLNVFMVDSERHTSDEAVVEVDIEPDSALSASRDSNRRR